MNQSLLPIVIPLFPIIAGLLLYFLTEYINPGIREKVAFFTTGLTLIMVGAMYPAIAGGNVLESGINLFSMPLTITFRVDTLDFFMTLLSAFLWFIATIYSPGYLAHSHARNRYYAFLLLAQGGCLGIFLTGDLLGLFVFFEFMAITTYVLIAHEEDSYALFAGAKYLYMTVAAGLSVFFGMIITYYLAGSLSLAGSGLITEPSYLSFLAFIGFIIGFGIKAGMFPVHVWLPDAHPAAPAPASALLSGVMIKTGAYGLIRVFMNVYSTEFFEKAPDYLNGISWENILTTIATITILLGSALAIQQDGLKRRLAYSSIAQIGYILLGISLLTETAMVGAVYHIFTHAFMKGCLFLCAGLIIEETGKKNISQMRGIGYRMPVTMLCFTFASLSMVGIPPFNGFISKWNLCMGALEIDRPFFVALLIVSSLLNSIYYFPVVVNAFFTTAKDPAHGNDAHGGAAHAAAGASHTHGGGHAAGHEAEQGAGHGNGGHGTGHGPGHKPKLSAETHHTSSVHGAGHGDGGHGAGHGSKQGEHNSSHDSSHGGHGGGHDGHGSGAGKMVFPEAPWGMVIPTAILALGCIVFALAPVNWPLEMVKIIAASLF